MKTRAEVVVIGGCSILYRLTKLGRRDVVLVERAAPGQPVEVEILGEWVAGEVAAAPLFDPAGTRIRA